MVVCGAQWWRPVEYLTRNGNNLPLPLLQFPLPVRPSMTQIVQGIVRATVIAMEIVVIPPAAIAATVSGIVITTVATATGIVATATGIAIVTAGIVTVTTIVEIAIMTAAIVIDVTATMIVVGIVTTIVAIVRTTSTISRGTVIAPWGFHHVVVRNVLLVGMFSLTRSHRSSTLPWYLRLVVSLMLV